MKILIIEDDFELSNELKILLDKNPYLHSEPVNSIIDVR